MDLVKENIRRIKSLMLLEDDFERDLNFYKTGSDQDTKQDGPTDDDNAVDGMDESELSEDEDAGGESSGGGAAYPSLTLWSSGVGRGPANPDTSKPREDKVTRGKGNKLKPEPWKSERKFGPTGNNYK